MTADYMIVLEPVSFFDEKITYPMTLPAKMLETKKTIGTSYKKLDKIYKITNVFKINIYEKVKPVNKKQLDALQAEFKRLTNTT